MKKELNIDIKKTYWNYNGKYQEAYNELSPLIPIQNLTNHDYMNLIITFGNLYYDLYNNGLMNKDIRLPDVMPYLEKFREEIISKLPSKKYLTAVKNGKKDHEAFELVMDAILQLKDKYPYVSELDPSETIGSYK